MPIYFNNIVSLGAWCQVTHQIRAKFGHSTSSPFDWLVTPLRSLNAVLYDDGKHLGESVEIRGPIPDVCLNNEPVCSNYGLLYHHEFPTDANMNCIVTDDAIRNCQSKLKHKYINMLKFCENSTTLFVRFGGHAEPAVAWPYLKDDTIVTSADLNALVNNISLHIPNARFTLLFVTISSLADLDLRETLDPRIIVQELPSSAITQSWEGQSELWSKMFDVLDIRLIEDDQKSTSPCAISS